MQRAMARQAEAERERRAKVINAEGEFQASERLKDAAMVIERHPIALQLRYLQTLLELGPVAVDDDRLPDSDRDAPAVPGRRRHTQLTPLRPWQTFATTRRPAAGWRSRRDGDAAGRNRDRVGRARRLPVLRGPTRTARHPRRCGSATGRQAGTCAWCRTSTRPSSGRRSSCTARSTCTRSRALGGDARPRRRGMAAPRARRRRHLFPVHQRGPRGRRVAPPLALAARVATRHAPAAAAEHGLPELVPVLEQRVG